MPGPEVRRLAYVDAIRPYFWNAVDGHMCEVVPHAKKESKCGNYCAILNIPHSSKIARITVFFKPLKYKYLKFG